jgi:hypothetical protein
MTRVTPAGLLVFWEESMFTGLDCSRTLTVGWHTFPAKRRPLMDMTELYKLIGAALTLLSAFACTAYMFLGSSRSLDSYPELKVQTTDTLRPASIQTRLKATGVERKHEC